MPKSATQRKPRSSSVKSAPAAAPPPRVARTASNKRELNGILKLLTCGSVDDGKSTLIGRLLWDASDLYDDQRATIERSGRQAGNSGQPDFSLLVDGLTAEREQGITIDIAWRYFDTERRRYVVIDSPGHEQYTRNMASGASHADVAILLVDARSGIKTQTRRHAAILDLVGVRRVVLAVNKMDLVDWSEERYRAISADFAELAKRFNFKDAIAIPVAATIGANVAEASKLTPWYNGPTLLQHLDGLPSRVTEAQGSFRMPVQTVLRDGLDFRGLAGTVSSGSISVGDSVIDALSGKSSRVQRIATMDGDLELARAGQAVAIELEHDLDIARGAVLAAPGAEPAAAGALDVRFVWLSETPFDSKAHYLLRTATDLVSISSLQIESLLNLETLEANPAKVCGVNDIGLAKVTLGRTVAADRFTDLPGTGTVMIVDALTGASVAGGTIAQTTAGGVKVPQPIKTTAGGFFILTRERLLKGLCSDLDDPSSPEFERRRKEVMKLLVEAGVMADYDI